MSAQAGIDPPITSYSSVRNSKYLSKKTLAQGKVNILTNVSLRLIFIKLWICSKIYNFHRHVRCCSPLVEHKSISTPCPKSGRWSDISIPLYCNSSIGNFNHFTGRYVFKLATEYTQINEFNFICLIIPGSCWWLLNYRCNFKCKQPNKKDNDPQTK